MDWLIIRDLEGLWLFKKMEMEVFEANDVTVISVLRACAETKALSVGMKLKEFVNVKGVNIISIVKTFGDNSHCDTGILAVT
ncbi:hypothetical protein L1987_38591 [Smallanthus sonchifolius]|uniref:Uncharacterized protein n=1 Tax=Smallanthus sonchifolius TaxID=185202 RepID=A0ACB9HJL9_9ASTR|nr:hypothetical protein L1987_38591 [Smallanthus sonchifolius]